MDTIFFSPLENFQTKSSHDKVSHMFSFIILHVFGHVTATCGKSSAAGSRVIGGTDAAPGEWPWQAKLRTKDSGFSCGGSLITPTWVMTAAHCVSSSDDPSVYSVTLGDLNREETEGSEQEFSVKRVVVHPKYNFPIAINNDIALLQLTRSANKTSFVNTVCLPDESEVVPVGTKCYISGKNELVIVCQYALELRTAGCTSHPSVKLRYFND